MFPETTVEVTGRDAPPLASLSPADFRVVNGVLDKIARKVRAAEFEGNRGSA